jgi:hypothetical protein
VNRQLFMPPPSDALVPELFDLVTLVSSRVAVEISLNWVAYLYTTYSGTWSTSARTCPGGT